MLPEVSPPTYAHLCVVALGPMDKIADLRRRHRLRIGLAECVEMSRQKDGGIGSRVDHPLFMLFIEFCPQLAESRHAEIDRLTARLAEPVPGLLKRRAIHRVIVLQRGIGGENRRACRNCSALSVKPPEPLSQRVYTCALGDEAIEVVVGADFKALGSNNENGVGKNIWTIRPYKRPQTRLQLISIKRAHSADN